MEKVENNLIKEEWIDGIIMMSPRPTYNHITVESSIWRGLDLYFKRSCAVAIEGALFLTKENVIELKEDTLRLKELIKRKGAELVPDVAVYCDKEQIFKRGFLGIPQLVVEVLSPGNTEDDTIKKKDTYEKYGVPEYWIASPMSKKVYVYSLEDGRYELKAEYKFLEEDIKSSRFKDLAVNIKDIYLLYDEEDDI